MKTLCRITVVVFTGLIFGGLAAAAPPKLIPSEIRVLPFCGTAKTQKLNPKDHDMFDELTVTKSDRIHIHGTKLYDTGRMNGQVVYFLGKLALIPPGDRTGKLRAKLGSAGLKDSVRRYYLVVELPSTLQSMEIVVRDGKRYDWSIKSEGIFTVFRVMAGKDEMVSIKAPTDQVQGVGFAAVVRFVKNQADLEVTFD